MKTYMLNFDQGPSRPSGKNLTPKEQEAGGSESPKRYFQVSKSTFRYCNGGQFKISLSLFLVYKNLCFLYIIKVAHVLIGSSV